MENGGKVKTENKLYNEAYNHDNFDIQSKKQVRRFDLSLIRYDRFPSFSKKCLWNRYNCNSHRHIDGAALFQKGSTVTSFIISFYQ